MNPNYLLFLIPVVLAAAYIQSPTIWVLLPLIADPTSLLITWILIGVVLLAVGFFHWRRVKYVFELEGQIPAALRILADAIASGIDAVSAFRILEDAKLRPMDSLARRVVSLTNLGGGSLEDALLKISSEIPSANFKRFAIILIEAMRSGARLNDVLNVAARSFAEVVEFKRNVVSQLRPYVVVFHVIMAIFAIVGDVVIYFLLPQISKLSSSVASAALPTYVAIPLFVYLGVIQSIIGGLVVGRAAYGRASAGLIHSGIASVITSVLLITPALLS